jgi:hypothetical protein
MERRSLFVMLAAAAVQGSKTIIAQPVPQSTGSSCDSLGWVSTVLTKMLTIKPGMTREALLKVFTTEGGISTPTQRIFVSRDCPYFKVNAEFRVVGRPERDGDGRINLEEGLADVITKISGPYLAYSIMD